MIKIMRKTIMLLVIPLVIGESIYKGIKTAWDHLYITKLLKRNFGEWYKMWKTM